MIVCDQDIRVQGRLLRMARLEGDKYKFLNDPERVVAGLKKSVDIFTFMQKLPETSPKYNYPMEWDNLAVLEVTTFDHWWTETLGFKARNKANRPRRRELSSGRHTLTIPSRTGFGKSTTRARCAREGDSHITARASNRCAR